jgi:hypothetical protein
VRTGQPIRRSQLHDRTILHAVRFEKYDSPKIRRSR